MRFEKQSDKQCSGADYTYRATMFQTQPSTINSIDSASYQGFYLDKVSEPSNLRLAIVAMTKCNSNKIRLQ